MAYDPRTLVGAIEQPGHIIAGRFEVKSRLGAGGMGIVLKVIDRELNNETVALKLLHPHLAQDHSSFQRFRNEVLVARSLSHPNIVRTYDIGRAEEGFYYISMEYVDGVSLREKLPQRDDKGRTIQGSRQILSLNDAVEILSQILCGVAYAHDKGVIHRDLKPANVMINSSSEVKLADFGTARILGMDTSLTQAGQIIGTPDYMSPEQIKAEKLDQCCDIYSLGIIAYELVVGERPFVADSAVAIAFKHLNDPLPGFTGAPYKVPLWYQNAVSKATAKNKNDRFQSALEFLAIIQENMPSAVKGTGYLAVKGIAVKASDSGAAGEHPGRFELGDVSPKRDSREWKLDYSQDRSEGLAPDPYAAYARPRSRGGRIGGLTAGVIGFVAALLVIVLIRSHEGTNRFVSSLLLPDEDKGLLVQLFDLKRQRSVKELSAIDKKLLEELQGDGRIEPVVAEPKAEPAGVKASSAVEQPVEEPAPAQAVEIANTQVKEPARVEVPKTEAVETAKAVAPVKESGSKERGAETAPGGTEAAPVESGSGTSAEASEGTQAAALAAIESASRPEVEKPKVQEPPQPVPTPAPIPVVANELEIYEGSVLLKDGASLSVDKLGSSKWTAKVQGLQGRAVADIKKAFNLNVFDPQSLQVVGKLVPERVSFEKGETAVISGGLRGLKQADVKSGSFRADLVYSGEVLASRAFGLHVLRVAVSPRTTMGAQKVTIVNVPTLVDESGRKITGAEHAAEIPRPIAPPPASASEPVLVPQPQAPAPSLSAGLPPARGYQEPAAVPQRREVAASSVGPVEDTASFVPPAPPSAVQEVRRSYSGSLRMLGAGGGERSLTLRLVFRGSDISGDATVEGFSPLVLAGKVLSHGGWEIFMQNAETKFRLTSVKKSDALFKGSYEMPNERLRGPWEVRAN